MAAWVKWALNEEDHTCPFHWKKWGEGVEKEVRERANIHYIGTDFPYRQGLFEGDLILYAFSAHLMAIDCIPLSKYTPPKTPNRHIGALILSIQAVRCHVYHLHHLIT